MARAGRGSGKKKGGRVSKRGGLVSRPFGREVGLDTFHLGRAGVPRRKNFEVWVGGVGGKKSVRKIGYRGKRKVDDTLVLLPSPPRGFGCFPHQTRGENPPEGDKKKGNGGN